MKINLSRLVSPAYSRVHASHAGQHRRAGGIGCTSLLSGHRCRTADRNCRDAPWSALPCHAPTSLDGHGVRYSAAGRESSCAGRIPLCTRIALWRAQTGCAWKSPASWAGNRIACSQQNPFLGYECDPLCVGRCEIRRRLTQRRLYVHPAPCAGLAWHAPSVGLVESAAELAVDAGHGSSSASRTFLMVTSLIFARPSA